MGFVIRTAVTAVAFLVATWLIPGVQIVGTLSLILAAIVFGLVNGFVRPIVAALALPLTVLTLGLFTLVINAAMFGLTALVIPGMSVSGFWAAFFGALVVWIVSWIANQVVGDRDAAVANR